MVAADDQAHDVRNHQAHETNHAADGNHGADHQCGSNKDLPLERGGFDPKLHSGFFPESDEIKRETLGPQPEESENDIGPDKSDSEISARRKATHEPEKQPLGLVEINDRIRNMITAAMKELKITPESSR